MTGNGIMVKLYQTFPLTTDKRFVVPRDCVDRDTKQFGIQLTTFCNKPCIRLISIEQINCVTSFLIRKRTQVSTVEEYRSLVNLLRSYSCSFIDIQNVDIHNRIVIPIEALRKLNVKMGDTLNVLEDSKSLVLMKK